MDNKVGTIVIATKVDNKELEKGLKETKKIAEKVDKEINKEPIIHYGEMSDKEKRKMEKQFTEMQKENEKMYRKADLGKYSQRKPKQRNLTGSMERTLDVFKVGPVERYSNEISSLESKLNGLLSQYQIMSQMKGFDEESEDVQELEEEIEKTASDLGKVKQKLDDINNTNAINNMDKNMQNVNSSLSGIGQKMSNLVTRAARWGLAIFGIRSAYMFLRQEMSVLSGYNEQLGAGIEYMRFAIAQALTPVIMAVIDLAKKLLYYTAYILKAWFGINIFANATADAFARTKDNIKGANNNAKQLQKTLAGFDEMNILQADGSVATGGGGGGIASPSFDLSNFDDIEIPGWVEWIAKNKDLILNTLKDIAIMIGIAFATVKVLEFLGVLSKISSALGGMSGLQIFGILSGVALIITGLVKTISSIIDLIKEPSWGNFVEVLNGVFIILTGIGLILVSLGNPWGWVTIGIGALGFLITSLTDTRSDTEKLRDAQNELNKAQNDFATAAQNQLNALDKLQKAQSDLRQTAYDLGMSEKEVMEKGQKLAEQIANQERDVSSLDETEKRIYKTYLDNIGAKTELTKKTEEVVEANKEQIRQDLKVYQMNAKMKGSYQEYRDAIIDAMDKGAISTAEATFRMSMAYLEADKTGKKVFEQDIPNYYKRSIADVMTGITIPISANPDPLFDTLNGLGKSIKNSIGRIQIDMSAALKGNSKGAIIYNAHGALINTPRLATGGIINRPGRGIPVGGEAGREGIIPLTDNMAMAQLGREIGKNVQVTANVPVSIGDRQIARIVRQMMAESDFEFNR